MGEHERASFGTTLRGALDDAGHTQAWLAGAIHTDAGQVSRWVHDRARPSPKHVRSIEEVLRIDLSTAFVASLQDYELFVSAPISGLSDEQIKEHRPDVDKVVSAAREVVSQAYWSGEEFTSLDERGAPDLATETSFKILARCKAYLYVQFAEILNPSGALVELGFALGRRVKTTMIIRKNLRTPYMFEGFQGVAARLECLPEARIYTVDDAEGAVRLIKRDGRRILGLNSQMPSASPPDELPELEAAAR